MELVRSWWRSSYRRVVEALAGVQKQSFGEVAKDVGKEATIGFIGDGVFGLLGKAFRGGRGVTPGKDLTATRT